MKTEWESISQAVSSVRAMISKELTESHNLSQTEAARLMGVSQPAVSQYVRRMRGKNERIFSDLEVAAGAKDIALLIRDGAVSREEIEQKFLDLCRLAAQKAK